MTRTVRGFTYEQVAGTIDHSLLRPELTLAEVRAGCELADRYRVTATAGILDDFRARAGT